MTPSWVGRSLPRLEDERLITGRGRYVADNTDPATLHLVLIRSPVAHARLKSMDLSEVAAMPGVRAVFTAADLAGLHSLPVMPVDADHVVVIGMPLLAAGRVRFAGEPVAAVVAETPAEAADAADYADVDYDPLPIVVDPHSATTAPPLHDEAPDNVLLRTVRRGGDIDAAFRDAALVIEATLTLPRVVAAPIEPRGAIASYDAADDVVSVLLSAQDPHRPRAQLAAALGRPVESVRIIVPDVGGAFGSKGALPAEAAVAAFAATRLRAPVQWTETRSENFLAAPQGRGLPAVQHLHPAAARRRPGSGRVQGGRRRRHRHRRRHEQGPHRTVSRRRPPGRCLHRRALGGPCRAAAGHRSGGDPAPEYHHPGRLPVSDRAR